MFENEMDGQVVIEMYGSFLEQEWEYNAETEKLLADNFPFRKTKLKRLDNRYKKDPEA